MSFFPEGFDPRDPSLRLLELVSIDTADGPFRFLAGTDGVFTDVDGNQWIGLALSSVSGLQSAIDGVAPEGQVSFTYFQDPDQPDLIGQVRDLGLDYVRGRAIRFYVQPLTRLEEMYAPATPPLLWLTRVMRQVSYVSNGAQDRQIVGSFETWAERRGVARRLILNTDGHARLIGEANPSLEFMPTDNFEEEKLFG